MRLLRRIDDALQANDSTISATTNSTVEFGTDPLINKDDLDRECTALLHAYRLIYDPELRLRLLSLVQAAAEQD